MVILTLDYIVYIAPDIPDIKCSWVKFHKYGNIWPVQFIENPSAEYECVIPSIYKFRSILVIPFFYPGNL